MIIYNIVITVIVNKLVIILISKGRYLVKKLIAWGMFLVGMILIAGLLVSCGQEGPEHLEPTPYYESQTNTGTQEPVTVYIPGFDHYEVSLTVDPATRTVSGISRTTFTNRTGEPLDTIVLRVFLNAFSEGENNYFSEFERRIFPNGQDYAYMDIQHVTLNNEDLEYDLNGTVLLLTPQEPLVPGETIQLVLQYDAYVPIMAHRTGANNQAMWFGMFLPILGVIGDNGWLAPDYYPIGDPFILGMASFEVEIITPADFIVAGTGVTTEEIALVEEDTRVTIFTATNARSFTFAVSPYFRRERIATEGGDLHLYYYTEDLPIEDIMEIIRTSMEHLSYRIGQYPFDHIRIVETDMFLSGMAFSNMIFMDTESLMQPNSQALTRLLGQQWFSHIVGNNPITEPWLSRGLVRYISATLFYDTPASLRAYMNEESALLRGRDDLFLTNDLGVFGSWMDYFNTHHIKGMLMFNALNNRIGDEMFWELVRQYFQAYHFQIATGADFKALASEIYGESLDGFFREWFADGTVPEIPAMPGREDEFLSP